MKTMEAAVKDKDEKLLKTLTYEVVDGKPIYYRGYKDVLEGKKHPEEVMASSYLQGKIAAMLVAKLFNELSQKGYVITTNETGVKTRGGYRAVDIGIFKEVGIEEREVISPIPPLVSVEIDVRAELENITFMEYIEKKVQDLFEVGTQKVIWILTKPRIVMVFERDREGRILRWDDEVEVIEGISFKLSDLIQP